MGNATRPDVYDLSTPLYTQTRLSDILAVDRRTVGQALETIPAREINGKSGWLLREAAPAIYKRMWKLDTKREADPDLMSPKDRLDHWRAEREKSKLDIEQRTLLRAADVERAVSEMLKILAQGIASLPDSLERECALDANTVAALHAKIDAARETLFIAVSHMQADDGDGG